MAAKTQVITRVCDLFCAIFSPSRGEGYSGLNRSRPVTLLPPLLLLTAQAAARAAEDLT
jgi:hypothetical protein